MDVGSQRARNKMSVLDNGKLQFNFITYFLQVLNIFVLCQWLTPLVYFSHSHSVLEKFGKGEPKTKKVWVNGDITSRVTTLLEPSIQLSDYRDKLLEILPDGYTVKNMAVQVISRDSGLMSKKISFIQI